MTPRFSAAITSGSKYAHSFRVLKLKDTQEQDETGDQIPGLDRYEELFPLVYGTLEPQLGKEVWAGDRVNFKGAAYAWTRYTTQIAEGMLLQWLGYDKVYAIISAINPHGRNLEIMMELEEMPVGQEIRNPT